MAQHYSNPGRASDPHALPNIETFYVARVERAGDTECPFCEPVATADDSDMPSTPHAEHVGWYWHACFPGCLPDGEPNGPFATEDEAIADAHANASDDDDNTTD